MSINRSSVIHNLIRAGQLTALTGVLALAAMTEGCSKSASPADSLPPAAALVFKGEGFLHNGNYPKLYTCDSSGISPGVSWESVPTGTKTFAITMHHYPPTGDKHVYWVVYNIPADIRSIPAGFTGVYSYGINTVNGRNTYTPPCSQGPGAKVYILTLYALQAQPVISKPASQVTMDVLLDAIRTTKLDSAIMNVTYTR
jgi:Raf kinase inhibitor-like YbhB/YbcL family protein